MIITDSFGILYKYSHITMHFDLYKPIFIIGPVRSGTTILADILSQNKEVAYWIEPKYIWKYKKAIAHDDIRTADEATKEVSHYIRSRFYKYMKDRGGSRFMEKTPSNVFRIPFINKIFPNAIYVQILRNPKDIILSTEKKWTSPVVNSAIKRRLLSNEVPLIDLPYYASEVARNLVGRKLMPENGYIWGQRFTGIETYRKNHSILETCAMQWKKAMESVSKELQVVPEQQKYLIRYEKLVAQPKEELSKLTDFLELESDAILNFAIENVENTNDRKYTSEQSKKLQSIDYIIREEMEKYSYN